MKPQYRNIIKRINKLNHRNEDINFKLEVFNNKEFDTFSVRISYSLPKSKFF
jgi:hypothetical protein